MREYYPVLDRNHKEFIDTRLDLDTIENLYQSKTKLYLTETLYVYTAESKNLLSLLRPDLKPEQSLRHKDGNILDNRLSNLQIIPNLPIKVTFKHKTFQSSIDPDGFHKISKFSNRLFRFMEEAEIWCWIQLFEDTYEYYDSIPKYIERTIMLSYIDFQVH